MQYRPHQEKAADIGDRIVHGNWSGTAGNDIVIADVVPGGGKTALGLILANKLLSARIVDSVVWLTPAVALRKQIADAAHSEWCNPGKYILYPCENETPLFPRDAHGCVSSYQQVLAGSILYKDHVRRSRTLLVLDEIQCLADEGDDFSRFAQAAESLRQMATFTLAMSGTLWRHDNRRIPFVGYTETDAEGKAKPRSDIRYTLDDGIADRAIRPPQFAHGNADVRWSEEGTSIEAVLSEASGRDEARARGTFLEKDGGWGALLQEAVSDWRQYCRDVHPSRMIVICGKREHARRVHDRLRKKMGVDSVLAVGDDPTSQDKIVAFRGGLGEALVSVEMVSFGFDAPDLTHLVFLAKHRSLPKSIQAFGRIWRWMGGVTAEQTAWIYAPNDRSMQAIVQWVSGQRDIGVREREERDAAAKSKAPEPLMWFPEHAQSSGFAFSSTDGEIPAEFAATVQMWRENCQPARGIRPHILADLARLQMNPPLAATRTEAPEDHASLRERITGRNGLAGTCDALYMRLGILNRHGKPWSFGDTNRERPDGWVARATMAELRDRIHELEDRLSRRRAAHGS
jgi:superfamily II DNA or RNA helicase